MCIISYVNRYKCNRIPMKNLEILHPDKTASFSVSTVVSLAKRFPQLGLSDAESLRLLREEFMDFTLSPSDLPSTQTYKCDHTKKVCAGPFWWQVGPWMVKQGLVGCTSSCLVSCAFPALMQMQRGGFQS